jgi:MurNAc alpha-1-phosphate uridylyltransferase
VLVPKPDYPTGADLALRDDGRIVRHAPGLVPLTFAGIAAYTPAFFHGVEPDRPSPLLPRFDAAMTAGQLTGEVYTGRWFDVGTVERLALADAAARGAEPPCAVHPAISTR